MNDSILFYAVLLSENWSCQVCQWVASIGILGQEAENIPFK